MNSASTFECFGLVIHGYDRGQILNLLKTRFANREATWIVTANPEILLEAKNNPGHWEALRHADLRLVDGKGLQFAGLLKGAKTARVAGVDLSEDIVAWCAKQGLKVFLLGSKEGVADKAAWELRRRYPDLKISAESGGHVARDGQLDEEAERTLSRMVEAQPDVVLVAYGHPKQDFWIHRYRSRLPNAKIFMGVGGTLDFWSGNVKRAPRWMRILGVEWLYRLICEPWRWRRIWRAVVVFPLAVALDKRPHETGR